MTFLAYLRSSKVLAVMRFRSVERDPLDLAREIIEADIGAALWTTPDLKSEMSGLIAGRDAQG